MKKTKDLKSNKGVTLLVLSITIVMILIISVTISVNVTGYVHMKGKTNLETDITKLKEEIDYYYSKNKELPIANKYTSAFILEKSVNDNENYFIIDLSKLNNLDLNYGKDYYTITDKTQEINNLKDIYIINEDSHVIYYPKGVYYNGKIYYTTLNLNDVVIEDVEITQ